MHPAIQYAMDREREERTALRDQFAMRALPVLLASGITAPEADRMPLAEFDARIAAHAYAVADAMLEARNPKA